MLTDIHSAFLFFFPGQKVCQRHLPCSASLQLAPIFFGLLLLSPHLPSSPTPYQGVTRETRNHGNPKPHNLSLKKNISMQNAFNAYIRRLGPSLVFSLLFGARKRWAFLLFAGAAAAGSPRWCSSPTTHFAQPKPSAPCAPIKLMWQWGLSFHHPSKTPWLLLLQREYCSWWGTGGFWYQLWKRWAALPSQEIIGRFCYSKGAQETNCLTSSLFPK